VKLKTAVLFDLVLGLQEPVKLTPDIITVCKGYQSLQLLSWHCTFCKRTHQFLPVVLKLDEPLAREHDQPALYFQVHRTKINTRIVKSLSRFSR
jgi:hypothetical protein